MHTRADNIRRTTARHVRRTRALGDGHRQVIATMCGERASPNICPCSGRPAGAGSTVSDRLSLVTVRPGIRKQNSHARTSRDPEGLPTSGNDQTASRDERRQPQVGTASSPQAGTSTTSCDDLSFAGRQTTATTAAVLFRPRPWTDGVRPFHGERNRGRSRCGASSRLAVPHPSGMHTGAPSTPEPANGDR